MNAQEPFVARANAVRSVILLNDFAWVNGGQSKIAIETALHLKARGLDVCLVAGRGPVDDRLITAGVECNIVGDHDILSDRNRLRASTKGIWNRDAAKALARCLDCRDPASTVIHVHGWAKSLSPSIGPVVTQAQAAHVYTLHEYFLACPNGGFYDYRAGEICKRRALGVSCATTNCDPRSYQHKLWRMARQAVLWGPGRMPRDLREVIYLAPEQREILGPYIPTTARWHYLPNPGEPAPKQRVAAEENHGFLFVGRLSPEKGAKIAASAAFKAGVPITFCGDGDQHDAILRANPNAKMLGWLSHDELREQMQKARCLVFPSLWYETYGLVVADALRAGLPVLASRSSVAASLVGEGVAGELVEAGDIEAWRAAIIRMKSDQLVKRFSEAAHARGRQLPTHDDHINQLLQVYNAAISRKHFGTTVELEAVQ